MMPKTEVIRVDYDADDLKDDSLYPRLRHAFEGLKAIEFPPHEGKWQIVELAHGDLGFKGSEYIKVVARQAYG